MKNRLILIMAVVISLVAAGGIYFFLDNVKKSYRVSKNFAGVVTAGQRIPARTQVTAQMIAVKEIPAEFINDRAVLDPNEVIGKVVKSDIFPGEQILRDKLVKEGDSSEGLSFLVTPGKRAVTVAVNDVSGVAGLLKVGDRVDVAGTFEIQGQEKSSVTSLLIQNVTVLSLDQNAGQGTGSKDGKKIAPEMRTVTLLVTPEQAQPLVLCSEKGTIRLLLRSPLDQETVSLPSTRMNHLIR